MTTLRKCGSSKVSALKCLAIESLCSILKAALPLSPNLEGEIIDILMYAYFPNERRIPLRLAHHMVLSNSMRFAFEVREVLWKELRDLFLPQEVRSILF